jgi:hypothetical protein
MKDKLKAAVLDMITKLLSVPSHVVDSVKAHFLTDPKAVLKAVIYLMIAWDLTLGQLTLISKVSDLMFKLIGELKAGVVAGGVPFAVVVAAVAVLVYLFKK